MKIKKSLFIAFSIVLSSTLVCHPVFAVLDDYIDKFANNNIIFYNPEECTQTSSSSASATLYGKTTTEKILNYLLDRGFTPAAASGVLGNAVIESNVLAARVGNSNKTFFGVFMFGRAYNPKLVKKLQDAGLEKYVAVDRYPAGSNEKAARRFEKEQPEEADRLLLIQLDHTLSKDYNGDTSWQKTINLNESEPWAPEYAAEVFMEEIERPTKGGNKNLYYKTNSSRATSKERRDNARKIYNKYFKSSSSNLSRVASVTTADVCCDPNGTRQTFDTYVGEKYVTDDETENNNRVNMFAAAAARNGATTANHAKSLVSFHLNNYEKTDKSQDIIEYSKNHGLNIAEKDTTFSNKTLTDAVKSVLIDGKRILPSAITQSVKASGSNISANNNGEEITLADTDKFLRGITKVTVGSTTLIFWDWSNPGVKSAEIYGYLESEPPSAGILSSSLGTSTGSNNGSGIVWDSGWVKNGLDGYSRAEATPASLSGLNAAFGGNYTSDSVKGTGKGPDKISLFVTNSTAGDTSNILNIYNGSPKPPHFSVDLKQMKIYQHGSIYRTAAAASDNGKAGIQVSIIGYENDSHGGENDLSNSSIFSETSWQYLVKFINALSLEIGVSFPSKVDHAKVGDAVWKNINNAISAIQASSSAVCPESSSSGDVRSLQETVVKLAWPQHHNKPFFDKKAEYQTALDAHLNRNNFYSNGLDCGVFVAVLMYESGWDKKYYPHGTVPQEDYVKKPSSGWKNINNELLDGTTTAQPGDVLLVNYGKSHHTLVYVGKISGFDSEYASASLNERSPMADGRGSRDITSDIKYSHYNIYRKVR